MKRHPCRTVIRKKLKDTFEEYEEFEEFESPRAYCVQCSVLWDSTLLCNLNSIFYGENNVWFRNQSC